MHQVQNAQRVRMGAHSGEFQLGQQSLSGVGRSACFLELRPALRHRMTLAHQHHIAVAQQGLLQGVAHLGQKTDGQVQLAVVQRGGNFVVGQRHGFEPHARRMVLQRQHQLGQKTRLANVTQVHTQHTGRALWVKHLRDVERIFDRAQRQLHRLRQPVGTRRRPHACATAFKQGITQHRPQTR